MRQLSFVLAATLGLIIAGCAGSSNNIAVPGLNQGLTSTPRVEAVLRNGSPVGDDFIYQDPQNIQSEDEIVFQLVSYTNNGGNVTRNVLPAASWRSSDTSNRYGNLAGNTGLFIAGERETPDRLIIAASYNGTEYTAYYRIKPREVRLLGRVVNTADPTQGLYGIVLEFYDQDNIKIGETRTAINGTFRASIPPVPITMSIMRESLAGSGFGQAFIYDGFLYQAGQQNCRVAVPVFETGTRQLPASIELVPDGTDPATLPPSGCSP